MQIMVSETPTLAGRHNHKQLLKKIMVLVCVLSLSIACLVPVSSRSNEPFVEPTTKDIIGLWSRSPCNPPESDITDGDSVCTMEFKDDGSFEMVDVPEWDTLSPEWNRVANSGKGTWELKYDSISLQFNWLNGSGVREMYRVFDISYDNPKYFLYVYVGDPDSGHTFVFEKQE